MDAYQFARKHQENSQFVRDVLLKAADGLVSTAAVMISVGAFQQDFNIDIIMLGISWMVARNCSMFISACSLVDKIILEINEGMLIIVLLMGGVGAANESHKAMMLSGVSGLVARICTKVAGEFATLYSQSEIEFPQTNTDADREDGDIAENQVSLEKRLLVGMTIVIAFSAGAMVSLLTAFYIKEYVVWVDKVMAAVSIALVLFGFLWAALGIGSNFDVCYGFCSCGLDDHCHYFCINQVDWLKSINYFPRYITKVCFLYCALEILLDYLDEIECV